MSYRVTVTARFEAAHRLLHYHGQPEPLHGHSYKVEVTLEARELDTEGLAVDFVAAKDSVAGIARELDYGFLNDHSSFRGRNTSAENLARHFAERVAAGLTEGRVRVAEVTVWEGPENRASWKAEP